MKTHAHTLMSSNCHLQACFSLKVLVLLYKEDKNDKLLITLKLHLIVYIEITLSNLYSAF